MRKLLLLAFSCGVSLWAADVTGNWDFTVETSQGSGNPTFVFKQEGEKLTGTYSGLLGKADVKGTVKGDKIEFGFEASGGGQNFKVSYKGTIESATKMKGEVELGELGKGSWTGVKK
ncbi:MAG: hypothetical protein HYR60_04225 [Acidobacteria bacterium]|nr:hypothetical protein [Acidobacteriota bacterium]MBI3472169.1 hypothetical protein [Candidatus Solibacter usitatus]